MRNYKCFVFMTFILLIPATCLCEKSILFFGHTDDLIADVSTEVLIEAYKQIGYSIKVKKLPAQRALVTSNKGLLDGEVNRVKGIDRKYTDLIMIQD